MSTLAPPVHMHVLRGIIMGGYCFFAFSRCNLGTNSGAGEVPFLRTQIFFLLDQQVRVVARRRKPCPPRCVCYKAAV